MTDNGGHKPYQGKKGVCDERRITAFIERASEGGYWAICPEVPGANG